MFKAVRFDKELAINHKENIINLLISSFETSNPHLSSDIDYFDQKFTLLVEYLEDDKAIFEGILINDHLVGFIWYFKKNMYVSQSTIHINHFVINEKFRNLGLGSILYSNVEKYAIKNDINTIELIVSKSNKNALQFYKHKGLLEEKLIMRKELK